MTSENTSHTARAHATLAPSAAHRWMVCPGSIVLEQGFPNTTSVYAAEGTAAHELASWCMANDEQPEDLLGFWIDIRSTSGYPFLEMDWLNNEEIEDNRYFEVNDDMVMSERMVSEIKSDLGPMGYSFDDVVKVIKKREWRREELQVLAVQLFGQLADYLEDVEGWHGEDRQDKAKAHREAR